jgi:hypothetical protein
MRNDIHRPGADDFNPGEYEHVRSFYQGTNDEAYRIYEYEAMVEREWLKSHGLDGPLPVFSGNFSEKQTCDHCGARFDYGEIVAHMPTMRYIHVGHICASETFELANRADMLRRNAARAIARANEIVKAQAAAAAFATTDRGAIVVAHLRANDWNNFYRDLLEKLTKFGTLTDGQMAAVERNMEKDNQRSAEREVRMVREAAMDKNPCPTGRGQITGEILSRKWKDTPYGDQLKMLVLDDRGFKVYGSVPSRLSGDDGVQSGDRITFMAEVSQSDDDELFGFFKRPTQAEILGDAPEGRRDLGAELEQRIPSGVGPCA